MRKKIVVFAIIVAILLGLGLWQKNNLKAIYMYFTSDTEEVSKILETNRENLEKEISKYSEDVPRALTKEEEELIASGELSVEDATKMLLEENNKNENVPENENPGKAETENPPLKEEKPEKDGKKNDESAIIKKYTAQFYSMKAYYMGQLSQIESKAKAEYTSLSTEEKKNLSKAAFVGKYASYALNLQSECDSKVDSLLKDMKKELKEAGADTGIITTIKEAYEAEKTARKAYYLNLVG